MSPEYHRVHLAFSRSEIVTAAAKLESILDRLHAYTDDVILAEREGAFEGRDSRGNPA